MILSEVELRSEIENGRLRFEPELPPNRYQAASLDLTLHNKFWRSTLVEAEGIDTTVDIDIADPYSYLQEEEADSIDLKPAEFVLGETAEAFSMPDHLVGWIEGKSGKARHGIVVHCTAPHIAPGWGRQEPHRITLEIVNHSPTKLKLRAGIPIAQLLVGRLTSPPRNPYSGIHQQKGS